MKIQPIGAALCLLLTACFTSEASNDTTSKTINKERNVMTKSEEIKPHFTPKQFLLKMLEMMTVSNSTADFTRERLEKVFGVQLKPTNAGGLIFSEKVSKKWTQEFEKYKVPMSESYSFSLAFHPTEDTPEIVERGELCEMTYEEFIGRAVMAGFIATPIYHAGTTVITNVHFKKNDLNINVGFSREYKRTKERPNPRLCIDLITIR